MATCKATEKTKSVLLGLLAAEARGIDAAEEAAALAVSSLIPRRKEEGMREQIAAANAKLADASKIAGRVARVLANEEDDTGTRNTAGGTIRAVRQYTGRNILEEGVAALDVVEEIGAERVKALLAEVRAERKAAEVAAKEAATEEAERKAPARKSK